MASIIHVTAIEIAVNAENHKCNVNKQNDIILTKTTFITLVTTAGLSSLRMLGSIANTKNS